MSWANELYKVYDLAHSKKASDLLPISHSTANAQIEVIIDEDGNFIDARPLEKEDAVTIIPVTEDSGARSSGIAPMPFADKLVYIAGDYPAYTEGKRSDNAEYFRAYMEQLDAWRTSDYGHPSVSAVFAYLQKMTLMEDLVGKEVLQKDPQTGKLLANTKIAGIAQEDSFVRFRVRYKDKSLEEFTWVDTTLHDSFIQFNKKLMGNEQLCYATGEIQPVTYKHPSKIRNSGDKARLISSNDESGFSYRGRFANQEEAISVSYEFSENP